MLGQFQMAWDSFNLDSTSFVHRGTMLVYHGREYEKINGDPLFDPNRHTRVQPFRYTTDGVPDFGEPVANGPLP